jgi:beta-lactam-binding protein with PASTA domain
VAVGCCAVMLGSCSSSHPTVKVPASAANQYPSDATAALCAAGLRPVFVSAPAIRDAGLGVNGYAVQSVHPGFGSEVKPGSAVEVRLVESVNGLVYHGHGSSAVLPDVTGLDVNKALREIARLRLQVNLTVATPTGALQVTTQEPAAGTSVPGGSTVVLHVGKVGSTGCT